MNIGRKFMAFCLLLFGVLGSQIGSAGANHGGGGDANEAEFKNICMKVSSQLFRSLLTKEDLGVEPQVLLELIWMVDVEAVDWGPLAENDLEGHNIRINGELWTELPIEEKEKVCIHQYLGFSEYLGYADVDDSSYQVTRNILAKMNEKFSGERLFDSLDGKVDSELPLKEEFAQTCREVVDEIQNAFLSKDDLGFDPHRLEYAIDTVPVSSTGFDLKLRGQNRMAVNNLDPSHLDSRAIVFKGKVWKALTRTQKRLLCVHEYLRFCGVDDAKNYGYSSHVIYRLDFLSRNKN